VFENKVLRRIFGPKREEVTKGWIKLHDEELHNLYSFVLFTKYYYGDRMGEDVMDTECNIHGK
jgi:hypothetical protein